MAEPTQSTVHKVELYCYDLSGGLARQLSAALLGGHHMEAVWHTSIVAHGQEVFFGGGEGISITAPGRSHHGNPVQVTQLGQTEIDKETFQMLIDDLRERFTASSYNLFNYNCNNFSDEFSKILIGSGIPQHILNMPADFQTALRNMSNRPQGGMANGAPAGGPAPPLGGLVDMINQRAQQSTTSQPAAPPSSVAESSTNAQPHPHDSLSPPITSLSSLPASPTYFIASPIKPDALARSLDEHIRAVRSPDFNAKADLQEARKIIVKEALPWIQDGSGSSAVGKVAARRNVDAQLAQRWRKANDVLCAQLPTAALFPLVDLLRHAAADGNAANHSTYNNAQLFSSALESLAPKLGKTQGPDEARSTWMTTMYLLANLSANKGDGGAAGITLLVAGLLHADLKVANVAATAAYNLCLVLSERLRQPNSASVEEVALEVLTALLEALKRTDLQADTVHRIAASLMRVMWRFPDLEALTGLAEVLEASEVLKEAGRRDNVVGAGSDRVAIEALLKDCERLMRT
ncbi:DUF862-domain-containing protein [Jaminaea rosea]|uniref:DUF862-domain-containing protein n=1 Tax=Jaminaea rosea TaxID=1569628 RepID=A0A316UVN3_9BASI|nr:DUF862-domain-containing protein [Jaminaea rosea]PWN29054.1 DUF862-domain-containing protein [Jaminaea rosea]